MRVAKIKGLICLVAVLAVISTTAIIATDSEIEQSENQSKEESTAIVTTQLATEVTTTKKVEETTEEITEATTEQVTEKPTEVTTVKPTATVKPTTKPVETTKPKETEAQIEKSETSEALYSASKFMNMGVIYWNGWRWTWYSERVLPGGGLNIPGRHADSSGYICDGDDYICLSSSSLSKGTVIATPFGKSGKVYDTGCASDTIDVYVNW